MAIIEREVTSLGDLIDQVTPARPHLDTGRWRDNGVYHGALDATWPLLTSLDRLGGVAPPHTKAHLEAHILRNFIRHARPYLPSPPANDWDFLVTAQHHGVPTRLLDWTYSPLIAAHFATRERHAAGAAVVWRLDWQQVHGAFGLPPLALLITDLETLFAETGLFTPWGMFDAPAQARPFACLLAPPALDMRLVVQSATFTLCSETSQTFDSFLEQHGLHAALTKLVIPAARIARVRDQLDLIGIDERHLFPDLDGVATALRRYYS